jgi:hypothetical protein
VAWERLSAQGFIWKNRGFEVKKALREASGALVTSQVENYWRKRDSAKFNIEFKIQRII